MVIFSKSSGFNNVALGKLETPLKMVIQHESDIYEKQKNVLTALFNIEKSNRFGETIASQTEFGEFLAAAEGAGAENDVVQDGFKKFIEHIQFMKEFIVTAEMAEDSVNGVSSDAKRRAENFYRAYEKTKIKLGCMALINGTKSVMNVNRANIDLTSPDGNPLFSSAHKFIKADMSHLTQSNYYYGAIATDAATFELALTDLAGKFRMIKDENGDALNYVPDTIIIPANRTKFESIVKKVVGSERTPGSNDNDINIQYGNWTVVVLPYWESDKDEFMIMSSEANENLRGNNFFNRIPLTVTAWEDNHTGNLIWTGRTRFGIGFGSWKHIMRAVNTDTAITDATLLADFPLSAAD